MIGLALAGTMAIIGDSAKSSVDRTIEDNFVGDYVVSNLFGQPFSAAVGAEMAQLPGVEEVIAQRWAYLELDGDPTALGAADPAVIEQALRIEMVSGSLADLAQGHRAGLRLLRR